jgi:uncharacterized protein YgiM (DUF1202 family)
MCRCGHRRAFERPASRMVRDTRVGDVGNCIRLLERQVLSGRAQERLENIDGGDVMAIKDGTSSQGWELEDAGAAEDRWVLEESEQQLGDEWDLEGTPEPVGQWQPVEYDKPRRGGPAWILPTVVTVALLAVLGYSAVTLVPELVDTLKEQVLGADLSIPLKSPTEEEPAAVALAPTEAAATEEPTLTLAPSETPTEEPPTATPSPTLAVAQQLFARVLSEYGVNARSGPSVDDEVLQILEPDQTYIVLGKVNDDWLQLFVADGPLSEDQPIEGFVAYASAEYLSEGMQPFAEDLWLKVLEKAGITPTATPAPPTPVEAEPSAETSTEPGAEEGGLPTVTPGGPADAETVTEPTVPSASGSVTITIDAVNGLNVRTAPELNADVVTLLADKSSVPAIGRYATNEWILVDLGNGATGWVFTELVNVAGDLAALPAITLSDLGPATPTPTETATPEPTPINTPVAPPEPFSSELPSGVPGAIVFSAAGVNAREVPRADAGVLTILPENAALPVVGRTSDGQWLQVELPDGSTAWIFRATIIPRGDINSVAVNDAAVQSASPTATPQSEATEAPTEAPTVEAQAEETPTAEPTAEEGATTSESGSESEVAAEEVPVSITATMRTVVVPVFSTPSADGEKIIQYARNTVIPVTGRSADGAWVQVLATTGDLGWVAAKSVETSSALESIPVVQ